MWQYFPLICLWCLLPASSYGVSVCRALSKHGCCCSVSDAYLMKGFIFPGLMRRTTGWGCLLYLRVSRWGPLACTLSSRSRAGCHFFDRASPSQPEVLGKTTSLPQGTHQHILPSSLQTPYQVHLETAYLFNQIQEQIVSLTYELQIQMQILVCQKIQ